MSRPKLLKNFKDCLRYMTARAWQKPFLNPRRFAANQLRKYGLTGGAVAAFRTARTFHLPAFTIVNGEHVSETVGSYGIYEPALTEAFLQLVQPGQVVVDIGMHLGYYTTLFACLVGDKGEVHAFEPTPSTRELALQNTKLFSQIFVHPFAVWSSVKLIDFRDYGVTWMAFNSFTGERTHTGMPEPKLFQVQTITLDEFRRGLKKKVSLIKVDAESAEKDILIGAREILESDRPIVSLEVGDSENQICSRQLIDHMQSIGYAPWEFDAGRFRRHIPRDRYDYDNLMFTHSSQTL